MAVKRVTMMLPDVSTIRTRGGELTMYFDSAKVPSKKAKLATRLAFAAALVRRTCEGQPASIRILKQCAKWIDEAAQVVP